LVIARSDPTSQTKVKVCGVTNPEDALFAAKNGADFIGMIVWPKSKRSIDVETAKQIAAASREGGAEPVGVFVSENAEEIVSKCSEIGLDIAQLHGDGSREALPQLPTKLRAIYVLNADAEGKLITKLPNDQEEADPALGGEKGWRKASDWMSRGRRTVDFLLVDGVNAGSGEAYDWSKLKVPRGASKKGWVLAGGLGPDNVADALSMTRANGRFGPAIADVSSGVTMECGIKKDPAKVKAFIDNAKNSA